MLRLSPNSEQTWSRIVKCTKMNTEMRDKAIQPCALPQRKTDGLTQGMIHMGTRNILKQLLSSLLKKLSSPLRTPAN